MNFLKYISSFKLLAGALICLIAVSTLITACEDSDKVDDVVLQSFGPSGVHHGDKIQFIGINLDKVSAIVLQPGIEVTQFESKSANLIEIIVPKEAEAGKVTLKTPNGDVVSKSMLSFEVPVEISSITAEARPGENITITGDFLNWIEKITFENGVVVEEFVSRSLTELVVQVPMEAQTGFLIFSTGGTDPLTFASENELTVTVPAVTAISPTSLRHTDDLTITGTDLDFITSIFFKGDLTVDAEAFVSQSATEIVVTVPAMTLKGQVTLKQASPVDVVTAEELIIILPIGTNVTPSPAVPGQDNITISGTDLDLVKSLKLPGVDAIPAANFQSQTPTEIIVAVPVGTKSGGITYTTIHDYSSNLGVNVIVPGDGPAPLNYYIYDDALQNGWANYDGWGWTTKDMANTEQVIKGSNSIKMVFNDQYGALQIGSPAADVFGGYTTLSFQVYAVEAQDMIVQIGSYNDTYLSIPQGWSVVDLPIASLDGNTNVADLRFKNNNPNFPNTLYFDEIGFKK